MVETQIVHITDLHIGDNSGDSDLLREGFYDEYLDPLATQIKSTANTPLNALIVTGDFVDRGAVSRFPHAKKVLEHFSSQLGIPTGVLFVCCGNHDILLDLEKDRKPARARDGYTKFQATFGTPQPKKSARLATLHKVGEKTYCLSIDATRGNKADLPGTLSGKQTDSLMNDLVKKVPRECTLIVASHYPAEVFPGDVSGVDPVEQNYYDRHFWRGGALFRERLSRFRESATSPTIWLSGDVHKPDQIVVNGVFHIGTGRIGTQIGRNDSILQRQAKLISIGSDSDVSITTFEYDMPTHVSQGHVGNWKVSGLKQSVRALGDGKPIRKIAVNPEAIQTPETPEKFGSLSLLRNTIANDAVLLAEHQRVRRPFGGLGHSYRCAFLDG